MYAGITPTPSNVNFKFDIRPGSKVRITTIHDHVFQGFVETNPSTAEVGYSISLIHCRPDNSKGTYLNLRRFFQSEILEVKLLSSPPEKDLSKFHQEADVRIIVNENDFRIGMSWLNRAESVGFNMFGQGTGRDAEFGWICFYTKGVMLAVDVLTLLDEMSPNVLWEALKVILESYAVKKIVHDNRQIIDYLDKKKNIRLHNYDDLSALDLSIRINKSRESSDELTSDQYVWRPLSSLLQDYLPKKINLDELKLLKTFELSPDGSDQFLKRPFPVDKFAKLMVVSLKHIVDLQLEMMAIRRKVFTQLHKNEMDTVLQSGTLETLISMAAPDNVSEQLQHFILDVARKTTK